MATLNEQPYTKTISPISPQSGGSQEALIILNILLICECLLPFLLIFAKKIRNNMATARIGSVISLQKLDQLIKQGLKDGSVVIEKTTIKVDDEKLFDL